MKFFKVELDALNDIRQQVMVALDQRNGRAEEPWQVDGTFNDGIHGYVALGVHHITGDFAPLLEEFIGTAGVEEISEEAYLAAQPQGEGPHPDPEEQ